MEVADTGSGPAVMLLHGAPSAVADFAPLVRALSPDHRVLVPELPGYGRSPRLEGAYSFARLYEQIERMLLDRGIGELAIVGFSLGAHHALALASSTRVQVTRVVSLAGFACLAPADRDAVERFVAMLSAPDADLLSPQMQEIARQRFLAPRYAADPEIAARLVPWLAAVSPAVLAAELAAEARADLRPQLARLSIPVVARAGELDVATPPSYSEEIATTCPHGRLEIVPDHGHALLLEQPDATVAAICAALA